MTASAPASNSDSTQARCQVHPDRFARGTCTRCGAFFCAADRRTVQELHYCASSGFTLSLLGLLFPLVSPFSLVGLYRVNPNATPPIGRKKQAIAGVILSVLGLAWGAVSLFSSRGLLRM